MRLKPNRFRQSSSVPINKPERRSSPFKKEPVDESIEICLNCPKKTCSGYCERLKTKSAK